MELASLLASRWRSRATTKIGTMIWRMFMSAAAGRKRQMVGNVSVSVVK